MVKTEVDDTEMVRADISAAGGAERVGDATVQHSGSASSSFGSDGRKLGEGCSSIFPSNDESSRDDGASKLPFRP